MSSTGPNSKSATTVDGVMRRVRAMMREIGMGGYWPYLPEEKWAEQAKRVVKAGNAFVNALEAVHDRPSRKKRSVSRR